jgi:hypothetical protein
MPNFAVTLTDPVTALPDITVAAGVLAIHDNSNYATSSEVGHLQANFDAYYKIKITNPAGTEYVFSALTGDLTADAVLSKPSVTIPTGTNYTYQGGDGRYLIAVIAVPTWSSGSSYLLTNTPFVYHSGVLYECIHDTGASVTAPAADATNWRVLSDEDDLPAKYRCALDSVIYGDAKKCYARRIYNVVVANNRIGDNFEKLLSDPEFMDAVRLFIAINALPVLMAADRWSEADLTINFTKLIAAKHETL